MIGWKFLFVSGKQRGKGKAMVKLNRDNFCLEDHRFLELKYIQKISWLLPFITSMMNLKLKEKHISPEEIPLCAAMYRYYCSLGGGHQAYQ